MNSDTRDQCSDQPTARPARRVGRLDFHRYDPDHGPAWRWRLAQRLVVGESRLHPDERAEVGEALAYFHGLAQVQTPSQLAAVQYRHRFLVAAELMHESNGRLRHEVEARLAAGQTPADIAAIAGADPEVIAKYEYYFFDLPPAGVGGDRLSGRIVDYPAWFKRDPTEHEAWMFVARAGGPVVLDLIIGDYLDRPDPNPRERHTLAERCRSVVWDYARLMRAAVPTADWFRRADKLFTYVIASRARAGEAAVLHEQWQVLRLSAGLPPVPPLPPESTTATMTTTTPGTEAP